MGLIKPLSCFVLGAKWQSRRKILTPAFHFNILQQFINILIEEGENMTHALKNAEGTVIKDLVPYISEHTLNAICGKSLVVSIFYRNHKKDIGYFIGLKDEETLFLRIDSTIISRSRKYL